MRGTPTLAIVTAPRVDAGVEEFLRICTGFVAGGGRLTLLEAGAGRGVLGGSRAGLTRSARRNLEGLADFDIMPVPVSGEELHDLLRGCERVLRVADPVRSGDPAVLVLDDALLERSSPPELLQALEQAGQVIRA